MGTLLGVLAGAFLYWVYDMTRVLPGEKLRAYLYVAMGERRLSFNLSHGMMLDSSSDKWMSTADEGYAW